MLRSELLGGNSSAWPRPYQTRVECCCQRQVKPKNIAMAGIPKEILFLTKFIL